jgi:hypothetical protein
MIGFFPHCCVAQQELLLFLPPFSVPARHFRFCIVIFLIAAPNSVCMCHDDDDFQRRYLQRRRQRSRRRHHLRHRRRRRSRMTSSSQSTETTGKMERERRRKRKNREVRLFKSTCRSQGCQVLLKSNFCQQYCMLQNNMMSGPKHSPFERDSWQPWMLWEIRLSAMLTSSLSESGESRGENERNGQNGEERHSESEKQQLSRKTTSE